MKFLLPLTITLLALAAACGGGGASGTTPIPTEPSVDPNLLTTIVLRSSDLPSGYAPAHAFNPPNAGATSYASSFRLNGVTISSTVVQYPDVQTRDQNIDHLRSGLAKVIGPETTYRLAGSDAAFLYLSSGSTPAQASLTLRGRYVTTIVYQTTDLSQSAIVTNRAELEQYSALMFDRLQKLLVDPSSITPIAGAPTFDANRQTQPVFVTATAVP
jgi:hypothetical protein